METLKIKRVFNVILALLQCANNGHLVFSHCWGHKYTTPIIKTINLLANALRTSSFKSKRSQYLP